MNSKQRRVRIRAGLPNALHRLSALCLMGDIEPEHAADIKAVLDNSNLQLGHFESAVRAIATVERGARLRHTLKSYTTELTIRWAPNMIGKTAHIIIHDEVTTIK